MIVAAESINLVAPVLAATEDRELDVGVGHLPASSWPDQGGNTVLEAHDVTFFSRLGQLGVGHFIQLSAPCRLWIYRVTSGRVVPRGSPILDTAAPTLTLITCWPTDALYLTNDRYVVSAELVSTTDTDLTALAPIPPSTVPAVNLPAGVAEGQVLPDAVGFPEGTLTTSDAPDGTSVSATSLAVTSNAFAAFDICVLAAERWNAAWWAAEAGPRPGPTLSAAAPLRGAKVTWFAPINLVLAAGGGHVDGADFTSVVGLGTRRYQLKAGFSVVEGRFVLSTWHLTAAS